MKPVKICFISLKSYPLFTNNSTAYFGGAEVQINLLASELAKDKHFSVSVITGDYGQPAIIKQGRLTLLKTKLFDFFTILKLADAGIYIERTINPKILLVYLFCRLFHKKFIYMVAHDWDLNHSVIKLADLIITQHQQQNKMLKFNNLVVPSLIKFGPNKKIFKRKYILWVGRADSWKNYQAFIKLAKNYPQEKFLMICRSGQQKTPATDLPNLKIISFVPATKILDFFRQAKILVNTSEAEGFPNTFLQAGVMKTPVLSFKVNPNNYLKTYNCGLIGSDLNLILKSPVKLKIMGQNHYDYVKKHHSLKNLEIFKQTLYKL